MLHSRHLRPSRERPRLEVAEIVRFHGGAYRERHFLSPRQRKALRDIVLCRTPALGGHEDMCDSCGHIEGGYNSCGNRHCPKCQALAQGRWIEERKERILPVHHFHLVFTLPAPLRPLALASQREVYDLLFRTASATLNAIARDERRLGGTPAVTAVLHTWNRELGFHPHIHAVVSGGGLSPDGRWIPSPREFLFPVRVLSRLFRGKFLDGLRRLVEAGKVRLPAGMDFPKVLAALYRQEWVVYAKAPFAGAEHVFEYLGRYTHRVAISNERLVSMGDTGVCFRTRDGKTKTLPPEEFLRRFLLHVLPKGFKKIRHYGLLAPSAVNTRLPEARAAIERQGLARPRSPEPAPPKASVAEEEPRPCPACGKGRMSIRIEIPATAGTGRWRGPAVDDSS